MNSVVEVQSKIRILYVDDNEGDFIIVRELLQGVDPEKYELIWAKNFEQGLEEMKIGGYDLYFVDYKLGAKNGLELVRDALQSGMMEPIVLISSHGNDQIDRTVIQIGAADFVDKDDLNGKRLHRIITHALERNKVSAQLEMARHEENERRHVTNIEKLANQPVHKFSVQHKEPVLKEKNPLIYEQLVREYRQLLETALESQAYQSDEELAEMVKNLAQKLGTLQASSWDVIQIHRDSMVYNISQSHPEIKLLYFEEGRWLVLQLMAHLVSTYQWMEFPEQGKPAN